MRGTIGTNHNLILSLHHFEGKNEGNHWNKSQLHFEFTSF